MLDLNSLLLRASECEVGLIVRTNDPRLLRNKLYAVKREFPSFASISIVQPPINPESTLWLVNKEAKNGTAEE